LTDTESTGLIRVITDFNYALEILDKYDHHKLKIAKTTKDDVFKISYKQAMNAVIELKKNTGGSSIFGQEKDESFKSSLNTIYQSFDGKDVYPSIEEKAAHLLYFVIKNHSFIDGNKRIAAFLFIWFLEKNKLLYNEDGNKRLADNALIALTLMIAISAPKEKDVMIRVIVNLINKNN